MPRPTPPEYRTANWPEYNAALKQRGSLDLWFDPEMDWFAVPDGRSGRPLRFSNGAIEFRLTLKGLFQLPLRQVTGLTQSPLMLAGLDWPAPDYTTLCRRRKSLSVDLDGRPSAGGLHLLVDSSGIKMMGEGEWKTRKHGASCRRQWRKVHLGSDAETLDIRAIEVTPNAIGDAPTPPDLLGQIPEDETILGVGGDGAYDTGDCHAAIAGRGAHPVIPVRRNGKTWTRDGPGVDARNEALRAMKRLGRAIWQKWSGYHRRSLVETKTHCFKLLGQRLGARTFDRQTTELKVRAAILNRCSQIGTPNTIRVA
ncbi:MAG: IS5 family transposase [Betaproteobacteria bacterium]|nr:IS5 family transposase [Betaproteobacteria bacterium]